MPVAVEGVRPRQAGFPSHGSHSSINAFGSPALRTIATPLLSCPEQLPAGVFCHKALYQFERFAGQEDNPVFVFAAGFMPAFSFGEVSLATIDQRS